MTKDEAKKLQKESKRSGGSVYPFPSEWSKFDGRSKHGITRRDGLAGLAMQGIASTWLSSGERWLKPSGVAEASYSLADALIAEGRKGE